MSLFLTKEDKHFQLAIWKTEEPHSFFEKELSSISLNKKYDDIKNETRKKEFLAVRFLVKKLLKTEVEIAYNEYGKPSLINNNSKISISHTKDYVAVILSSSHEIAIDIETLSKRAHKMQTKFMHPNELLNSNEQNEPIYSILHWSAKECLFKLIHENAIDFKEHLRIFDFEIATQGVLNAQELKTNKHTKTNINYQVFNDFILSWIIKD